MNNKRMKYKTTLSISLSLLSLLDNYILDSIIIITPNDKFCEQLMKNRKIPVCLCEYFSIIYLYNIWSILTFDIDNS